MEAAIFDLDGVLTRTATLHMAAWKALFDPLLRSRAERTGTPFEPFSEEEYREHVDGRPREEGIRAFLAERGMRLPDVSGDDPPGAATVKRLAARKDTLFRRALEESGVEVEPGALRLVDGLRARGIPVGVASSSRNCRPILDRAGLAGRFDAVVDGVDLERLGLRGKPDPDLFLACISALGKSDPSCALVVEDALAGVEAARRGGFGLVVGVDHGGMGESLRSHGAHRVVRSLGELSVPELESALHPCGDPRRVRDL